jgi:pyridoxine kinase
MARVLILSSYVASSRVGGGAQALALARLGIEPILIPTVLFGRHPGHGPPGGGPVDAATFVAMIGGVEAQGQFARLDAVITGYFSGPEQVAVAADALNRVKAAAPQTSLIVDPIMGDEGKGLYVQQAVAEAIATLLVPRADIVAPNAWELGRLTGGAVSDPASAVTAARALGKPVMVSSVRAGAAIGVVHAEAGEAWFASHPAATAAPNGTGDLLTALFTAALLGGFAGPEALGLAVGGVAKAMCDAAGLDELPLKSFPMTLAASPLVRLEPLHG